MSNKQRYYPNSTGEQMNWLRNFANKLPHYTTALDLVPAEVALILQDALWTAYIVGEWQPASRIFAKAATQYAKDTEGGKGSSPLMVFIPPPLPEGVVERPFGALNRLFKFVQIIKCRKACTEAVGRDLGITITASQAEHAAPELKLNISSGPDGQRVEIRYIKWGHLGLWLECRRADGDWEHLTLCTLSPYRDDRPLLMPGQPEVREYRARFWDKGSANGDWSSVARITVGV